MLGHQLQGVRLEILHGYTESWKNKKSHEMSVEERLDLRGAAARRTSSASDASAGG